MRDQIISFLAQGFSKESVLSATGCSSALFEEILKSENFVQDLAVKKDEELQSRIERRYSKVEEKILKKLDNELDLLETPQLCRVLDTIARNKAAYRKPVNHFTHPTAALQITVNVPQPALNQKVVMDSNNQVIAVGERVMTALPLQNVKELFSQFDSKEIRNDLDLPATSSA